LKLLKIIKIVKFDENNIFHMKNISAGHQINGIAIPPLISLFGLVFYQATLRKANESISTDFMNPLRACISSTSNC